MAEPFRIHPTAVYTADDLRGLIHPDDLEYEREHHRLRFTEIGDQPVYLGAWLLDWLEQEADRWKAIHDQIRADNALKRAANLAHSTNCP